jgi:hypothetical protein
LCRSKIVLRAIVWGEILSVQTDLGGGGETRVGGFCEAVILTVSEERMSESDVDSPIYPRRENIWKGGLKAGEAKCEVIHEAKCMIALWEVQA